MNAVPPSPRPAGFEPTQRGSYGYTTTEHLRFADVDMHGHINNVSFLVFFENARVSYIDSHMPELAASKLGVILAHIDIDYRSQLFYPGSITAAARLLEIRRSSLVIGQAIFDGDGRCAATGHAVVVIFDHAAGRTRTIAGEVRSGLERLVASPDGASR